MSTTDFTRQTHHEFLTASSQALVDANLQLSLANVGDTLAKRNREAWETFPQSAPLRELARQIKDATLADLAGHLETLEASVRERGGEVHYAGDGDDACRIVTDILRSRGAKRVVKSKSMTTEEIHLNDALEAAGIEPIETDLGEYIVQLSKQRPSHLVAPALHLRMPEIHQLLSTDAGETLPNTPEDLCAYARTRLRDAFATADAGITGANFAVAETGTIVLISNEGNARLTVTMPKLHIAILGIEKVIPKLADLPIFLKVLARAATGQKLSIYTTLANGPRKPDELEGPDEFHVVLLDNGRTRILEGPLRESLFCIRCGACLNVCPIYRNIGGHAYGGTYSGPIGAVLTPLYDGLTNNRHLPHASSLCGACQAACPVKIAIPEMLIQLRDQLHKEPGEMHWAEAQAYGLWARSMRSPRLYRFLTWLATRTVGRVLPSGWLKKLPGPLHGWTKNRDFPAPARERFRDWWSREGME
ncbi:MAG: iron-sulfur cluster-binding protein [Planctomycetia bacterium]|nr:iron-sulfur cluster-binding protein [Planctomycetia bacterium]